MVADFSPGELLCDCRKGPSTAQADGGVQCVPKEVEPSRGELASPQDQGEEYRQILPRGLSRGVPDLCFQSCCGGWVPSYFEVLRRGSFDEKDPSGTPRRRVELYDGRCRTNGGQLCDDYLLKWLEGLVRASGGRKKSPQPRGCALKAPRRKSAGRCFWLAAARCCS